MTVTARRVLLAQRPHGLPDVNSWSTVEVELPGPDDGEVLVQVSYLSAVSRTATDGGRTNGRATDEGPRRSVCGLTFAAELSVHIPASAPCPAGFPGLGGRGRAGAVMARVAVRGSVTLAGRADRARAARRFVFPVKAASRSFSH